MKTFLKFVGAAVLGWVIAASMFIYTFWRFMTGRKPRYNGFLKGGPK